MKIYATVRKKTFSFILLFSVSWALIFYTPSVWFLAKFLKIADTPRKTDAIIVFAGGVGESGEAGQGYEERTSYAVELYRKGYAENIIFSSGYSYTFKEAELMKVLAVSLGVPEQTITLESKATNTYENVRYSKEILDRHGWKVVLLVSSPYHMRRVSLVFDKIAKDIKVFYTPVPNSIFYSRQQINSFGKKSWRKINFMQLKGILHEYIGILYYWYKDYI